MEKVEINEQWKLDGDCSICRRRSYCSKVCARNRNKSLSELNNLFAKLMVHRLFGGEFTYDEDSSL